MRGIVKTHAFLHFVAFYLLLHAFSYDSRVGWGGFTGILPNKTPSWRSVGYNTVGMGAARDRAEKHRKR